MKTNKEDLLKKGIILEEDNFPMSSYCGCSRLVTSDKKYSPWFKTMRDLKNGFFLLRYEEYRYLLNIETMESSSSFVDFSDLGNGLFLMTNSFSRNYYFLQTSGKMRESHSYKSVKQLEEGLFLVELDEDWSFRTYCILNTTTMVESCSFCYSTMKKLESGIFLIKSRCMGCDNPFYSFFDASKMHMSGLIEFAWVEKLEEKGVFLIGYEKSHSWNVEVRGKSISFFDAATMETGELIEFQTMKRLKNKILLLKNKNNKACLVNLRTRKHSSWV